MSIYGLRRGLAYSTDQGRNYTTFDKVNNFPEFRKKNATCIKRNKEGLWVSGTEGIFLGSMKEGVLRKYKYNNYGIKHFHINEEGTFWLATNGDRLIRWNPETDDFCTEQKEIALTSVP